PLHLWKQVLLFPSVPTRTASQSWPKASGPTMGKVSESLTLTHNISGVSITDSSCIWDWIRQTPDRDLKPVVLQYPFPGLQHIVSSFQTRVTSSADPSRNQLSLEVLSPAAVVMAAYFCSPRELEKGPVLDTQAGPGQNWKEEG
uniref:Uncharacterized protein n=1 Tax=Bubo bubo TaxID=30461 RepID=A0A8C0ICF7_BUBBB